MHRLVCETDHVAVSLALTVQQALPSTGTIAPILTNLIQTMRLDTGRDLDSYLAPFKYGQCPDADSDADSPCLNRGRH